MKEINTRKRTIGINFNTSEEADIVLWAPYAEKASVVLKQKNTLLPLNKGEHGYWRLSTPEIKPGDLYKFLLDEEKERPDPASLFQPEGVHGPSTALDVTDFIWTDHTWSNIPLRDYIIYELHTGTFTTEGTFAGIEKKLDYLKQLGINAIEIMPVAQFPGKRNWGYDGVYPFAVQDSYGGPDGLKHLVNICHSKGLAVILDVVYNHMGPEGNYMRDFGPYFTDKYSTPWGEAINFDDEWCDGVRTYFIENVLMWFRDFHIDALRMDAVHALKDFSATHILQEIRQYVDQLMAVTGRKHFLIIECDLNDPRFIDPVSKNGFGMDSQWIDEFHHALRITAGGDRNGYYSDFEGIHHLTKAYKDAYVYDGIYSEHRKKTFGKKATENPASQFIVFSQNHDQIGNRMLGERTSQLNSFEMQKLLAGAVLVSPYLPMLFMGEEYSEPHPFLYFVSHTDPELAKAVCEGRKAEFSAFHSVGEAPDPGAESTFNESKLQWELVEQEPHGTMFRYYQALIALRKQHPVLKNTDRKQLDVNVGGNNQILVLHRWQKEQHLICLMNFSKEQQTVTLPDHITQWEKLLDSASPEWGGPQSADDSVQSGATITLQPESLLIYA